MGIVGLVVHGLGQGPELGRSIARTDLLLLIDRHIDLQILPHHQITCGIVCFCHLLLIEEPAQHRVIICLLCLIGLPVLRLIREFRQIVRIQRLQLRIIILRFIHIKGQLDIRTRGRILTGVCPCRKLPGGEHDHVNVRSVLVRIINARILQRCRVVCQWIGRGLAAHSIGE